MSEFRTIINYCEVDLDGDGDVEITESNGNTVWLPREALIEWLATLPPIASAS